MRIATYNIEWFNTLFDDAGGVIEDTSWSSRYDVTKAMQAHAIGNVMARINADMIMVIEAPDTSKHRDGGIALESFANRFGLRVSKAMMGFSNTTQQEIALMYDPARVSVQHRPGSTARAPQFDQTFLIDLDVDEKREQVE